MSVDEDADGWCDVCGAWWTECDCDYDDYYEMLRKEGELDWW